MTEDLMTRHEFQLLCMYLEGPQGCDFTRGEDPMDISWNCDNQLTLTRKWLKSQHLAVDTNVTALQELGGFCDCEVLFNVAGHWEGSGG